VPLAQATARESAAGVIVPFALVALLISVTQRRRVSEPVLIGRLVSPPTPPPRWLA